MVVSILQNLPEGSITAGLVALLFVLLATGKLITRREHEGRVGDLKEQADTWREAAVTSEDNLKRALEQGETTIDLLNSIKRAAGEGDSS